MQRSFKLKARPLCICLQNNSRIDPQLLSKAGEAAVRCDGRWQLQVRCTLLLRLCKLGLSLDLPQIFVQPSGNSAVEARLSSLS